jgi:hypothetical protein
MVSILCLSYFVDATVSYHMTFNFFVADGILQHSYDPRPGLRLLETLHMITLMSKISIYDCYCALEKLTDNVGTHSPKVSFSLLFSCIKGKYDCDDCAYIG